MGKEEKIKEAWGLFWVRLTEIQKQEALLNNGGVSIGYSKTQSQLFKDIYKTKSFDLEPCRPKSLAGIENNNGWISIEKESDVPEYGYYEVIERKTGNHSRATLENEFGVKRLFMHYSHYQKIKEIPKPIY